MRLPRLKKLGIRAVKDISFRTGILKNQFFDIYPFMHEPHQLEFLLKCINETRDVPGSNVEVGCAQGATTIFLKKYLSHLGVEKRYVALDTFGGFTSADVNFEIDNRGKSVALKDEFIINRRNWVVESIRRCGVTDVDVVQCDATTFNFGSVGPISFCLIDVDLYKPVRAVLPLVYENLSPNGVIVVDDCIKDSKWDGALDAYNEFVAGNGLPTQIVCDKYGLVRKTEGSV